MPIIFPLKEQIVIQKTLEQPENPQTESYPTTSPTTVKLFTSPQARDNYPTLFSFGRVMFNP